MDGGAGGLQSMAQRVGHDSETKQQLKQHQLIVL